jgi:hypothetical protein
LCKIGTFAEIKIKHFILFLILHCKLTSVAVYTRSDPIAKGEKWTAALDASSQVSWQASVGSALGKTNIIQGGVFLKSRSFNVAKLKPVEGRSGQYVKTFADHYYPQSPSTANLETLMNHPSIISGVSWFENEVLTAAALSKPFVMGETNSGGFILSTFFSGTRHGSYGPLTTRSEYSSRRRWRNQFYIWCCIVDFGLCNAGYADRH